MDIQEIFRRAQEHYRTGRLDEAEGDCRALLEIVPGHAEVLNLLGAVRQAKGDRAGAMELWERAGESEAPLPQALHNLGAALVEEGRYADAESYLRRALAVKPDYVQALVTLGVSLHRRERLDEAIAEYRRALAIQPDFFDALLNLGDAFYAKGERAEAERFYRQAAALRPHVPQVHVRLATALLSRGEFEEGWREYQWRWQLPGFPSPRFKRPYPRWDGSPLGGRTLLLFTEQGFGDAIQFVRLAARVAERGGRVLLACPPELVRLFQSVRGVARVFADGEALDPFDVYCSLLDLPLLLEVRAETVLAKAPYVSADASRRTFWARQMPAEKRMRIGLAWRGKLHDFISADEWAGLVRIPEAWVCSLQQGVGLTASSGIQMWEEPFGDFADTAALIEQLDLVITVDTAVAHLAGALGKAVWILLKAPVDWRWMHGGEKCPWYPTARLFKIPPGESAELTINAMVTQAAAFARAHLE